MNLSRLFELSTFPKNFHADDITMIIENGQPVFSALLCYKLSLPTAMTQGREKRFTDKDLAKIAILKGSIDRGKPSEQWMVIEKEDWFTFQYRPKDWNSRISSKLSKLSTIIDYFNGWIHEWSIA